MPPKLTRPVGQAAGRELRIALSDEQWELVADLFDPPGAARETLESRL